MIPFFRASMMFILSVYATVGRFAKVVAVSYATVGRFARVVAVKGLDFAPTNTLDFVSTNTLDFVSTNTLDLLPKPKTCCFVTRKSLIYFIP
jgi:hypothetical protein